MGKHDLVTISSPKLPVAEAYRTLRTNIQFSSIDKRIQAICVTSTSPGEGKSTVSSNLAVVMAEAGKKTLLIDCDQRKSQLHKIFELSNAVGLSDILAEEAVFEETVQDTGIDNLQVLTAGTKPPNPSELLASSKMKNFIQLLKAKYDFIIMDTPPVLVVTDAQLLADYTDGYLLVVSAAGVDRDAAARAKELLIKVNAKLLGVVLNNVEVKDSTYYTYYYNTTYTSERHKRRRRRM